MEGRSLSDLKVADLRLELEKRNKDKTGVKQVLVDRLREALKEFGHDPNAYRFGVSNNSNGRDSELNTLNEDDSDSEKGAIVVDDEQMEAKKAPEDSAPYVVQVGDQEEDLDYDLKTDSAEKSLTTAKNLNTEKEEEISKELEAASGKSQSSDAELRRNLWVSNLPKTAKAVDIKEHFGKVGKVLSATVVMSTRSPGGRFCFLQMATEQDASKAALELNGTTFKDSKLTVEATSRRPPTLRSQDLGASTVRRLPAKKPAARRRSAVLQSRLHARSRALRREEAAMNARRAALSKAREDAIARQRSYASSRMLAYQRARLLAASRYRLMRGLQQVMQQSMGRPQPPTVPIGLSHSSMRHGPLFGVDSRRRESRAQYESQSRRSLPIDRRRSPPRSRLPEPPRPLMSIRHSEPVSRRPDPRDRVPPMISSDPRRRLPLPSSASRISDHSIRYERMDRPSLEDARSFNRPVEPRRSRNEPRPMDRLSYERSRSYANGDRPSSFEQIRYNQSYMGPSPGRTQQRSPIAPPRQDFRRVSRSPPRSRSNMVRQSPLSAQRSVRDIRDRSPLRNSPGSPSFRPKVVDYGHRSGFSDPRNSSMWRQNDSIVSGHTWKPAGHAFVANYGRGGSGRRYP